MGDYSLSSLATKDIADIYEFRIVKFGYDQANQYLSALEDTFKILSEKPELGRKSYYLMNGLLRFKYQSLIIFFLVVENGVFIVRVLGERIDFIRHL